MSGKGLRISASLILPIDAVTQTLACIGRKGAGKTYLAGVLAEQMLDIGAQTLVLDPVGNWWGLRLKADGKAKGKEIFVIGGANGDVPILPDSGARIAKLLVEKPVSAILDISEFRQGERKRFAAEFAEEFFHLKKRQRSAVHLFIEEAQLFAPQQVRPDDARMLGAFESLIRLGRNYGIGATMITQRPQSVNKEVLSQVECLCVLQVNGKHERKALDEWVQEKGADRALVGELPGLPQGEGYVWSPSWLRVFERMKFAKKTTFDASATPEVGAQTAAAVLSKIDVESLKQDLQEVISKAEKDDPKALRKRIAELETALKKTPPVEKIDIDFLVKEQAKKIESIFRERYREPLEKTIFPLVKDLNESMRVLLGSANSWKFPVSEITVKEEPPRTKQVPQFHSQAKAMADLWNLSLPEQKILNAIAWLQAIGVDAPEQTAVAFLAGYTAGGGAFKNPRSRLSSQGLVEYLAGNLIRLTDVGRQIAVVEDVPRSNRALHEAIFRRLGGPEQRLLRPLLDAHPGSLTMDQLAQAANYTADGGAFKNPRGRLKTLGLIEYPEVGRVRARDILFPQNG